jgi:hypothetical protein
MSTPTTPKVSRLQRITHLITGLQNNPPATKSITIIGQNMSIPALIALLITLQKALQQNATAKATYAKVVAAANALLKTNEALLSALRPALIQAYGADLNGLAACGIEVKRQPRKKTAEKAASAAKGKATRRKNAAAAPRPTVLIADPSGVVMDAEGVVQPAPAAPAPEAAPAAPGAPAPAAPLAVPAVK